MKVLQTESNLKIIDVRSPSEYEDGHLTNSENLPYSNPEDFGSKIEKLQDLNSLNYVICQTGNRSQKAIKFLKSQYPSNNYINISGGYNALDAELIPSKPSQSK